MAMKEHPRTLTLERFASGKDGRANAFKKKKQANKRKLFEKAQLKRRYAKLLKKEAQAESGEAADHHHQTNQDGGKKDLQSAQTALSSRHDGRLTLQQKIANTGAGKRKRGVRSAITEEQEERRDDVDGDRQGGQGGGGGDVQPVGSRNQENGKRRKQGHRPDPFQEAKAKADQKRNEEEERQNERDRQRQEKEQRGKKRRKQHALLSKRTRGGQPVMKHTMQHLLAKIKSQS